MSRNLKKVVKPPHKIQLFKNFSKAVVRHAKDGFKKVTKEQYESRLSVCTSGCEMFDKEQGRCLDVKCGCFLSKKAWWRSENCPQNKWPKIAEEETCPPPSSSDIPE